MVKCLPTSHAIPRCQTLIEADDVDRTSLIANCWNCNEEFSIADPAARPIQAETRRRAPKWQWASAVVKSLAGMAGHCPGPHETHLECGLESSGSRKLGHVPILAAGPFIPSLLYRAHPF
jgi:hypothetical protein